MKIGMVICGGTLAYQRLSSSGGERAFGLRPGRLSAGERRLGELITALYARPHFRLGHYGCLPRIRQASMPFGAGQNAMTTLSAMFGDLAPSGALSTRTLSAKLCV